MSFPRRRRVNNSKDWNREGPPGHRDQPTGMHGHVDTENTGSEADYLKSLVDSRAKVTVVLKTGEKLRGRIRYYDRYCFSLGIAAKGPRLFLRKENIAYISEEKAAAGQPSPPAEPDTEFS